MARKSKEKNVCNNCEKDFDELVTRQGFTMTHYIEWVCRKCFKELEGVDFEKYGEEHFYSQRRVE